MVAPSSEQQPPGPTRDTARSDAIDALTSRGQTAPTADELADQHLRLDLIAQIPERSRRYLLRLALG